MKVNLSQAFSNDAPKDLVLTDIIQNYSLKTGLGLLSS